MGTPPRNQGQGWWQRRCQQDDQDYQQQSKPVTIAQRPQQPPATRQPQQAATRQPQQAEARQAQQAAPRQPQQAVSAVDDFCPSAAPDPKTLPKPTGFFGAKVNVPSHGQPQLSDPPQVKWRYWSFLYIYYLNM